MIQLLKKLPFFFMFLLMSFIYLMCGYIAGYYYGYNQGQQDYYELVEKMHNH
jgi:hypothetical protein